MFVDGDFAASRIEQTKQQMNKGALSCPALTHHAKRLTWLMDSDDCGVYARMLSIVQTTIRMNSVVVQAPPVLLAR